MAWPGWYPYPGIWFGGPYLSFGVGFGIGWFGGFGWGWGHWGFDWHNRYAMYNHGRYYSRSRTFYNRNNFYRGAGGRGGVNGGRGGVTHAPTQGIRPRRNIGGRGGVYNRPGATARPFNGNTAGGSRIRCTPRSERRPLRRLQRLRPWRTGQELFVTRKRQRRVEQRMAAEDLTAVAADRGGGGGRSLIEVSLGPCVACKNLEMERSHMRRTKLNFDQFHRANLAKLAAVAILLTGCFSTRSMAQQPGQKTFSSAEDASNALVTAAQNNDEKAMLDILGPDGKQIVSSGDEAEDAESRANFVKRYQEMHRLVKEPDGTTVLYIGAHNWPTPIPLVNKGNSWYFDTEAGKKEILYRRIGRNELSAIRVCQELVAAQKEYSPHSTTSTLRKSSAMKGSTMAFIGKLPRRTPEPHWAAGGSRRCRGLCQKPGRRSDSLPRLLLPHPDASGQKRPSGGREKLHGKRQNDRGLRFRGLSGGIQVFGRDDIHCWPGWSRVSRRISARRPMFSPKP